MKSFTIAAAVSALFASTASAAIDPIVIKGSKFFYKTNGTQFFMKGVAYQQGVGTNTSQTDTSKKYVDPLGDPATCKRDIPKLQALQTNTIRVYAIDPTTNHDTCMQALADAGIYVIADLSQPGESIVRDDPSWSTSLFARYTSVVDVLAKYDNTLGFFAGNEVSNAVNNTNASAFVKAAVRDTKSYIKNKNYRTIGVGYATNDDADIRSNLAAYFDCGDSSESIDFWGYNIYSWCGDSSFQKSGYDVRTKEFEKYNVPVFFAEYGCNTPRPREFTEVGALYGDDMTGVWSGGIVYMYFEEDNKFGLVSVDGNTVTENDDFKALSSQIAKVTPSGVNMNSYSPSNTAPSSCPGIASTWAAKASPLPPVVNAQLCECMYSGLSCVVKSTIDEKNYKRVFDQVCGYDDGKHCDGIKKNATTGDFGAYGMCNSTQQLGWALNSYNKAHAGQNGCDFSGNATTKAAASSTATDCKSLVSAAGTDGKGTVTAAPTAGSTGGAGGAGSSSKKSGAGNVLKAPGSHFESGLLQLGIYAFGAVVSGVAMILL